MAYFYLILSGVFEVFWAIGMKYTEDFTKFFPTAFTVLSMIIGVYFLALATKEIPLGVAYAVCTGVGIIGTWLFSAILFNEITSIPQVAFISCILVGIVGLHLIE